jgi:hypothetical protein
MSAKRRGQYVRVVGRYVEVACGPCPDDWQVRAVVVGKGVEITRSERTNGWVEKRVLRKWCKAVRTLAAEECVS